MKTGLRSIFPAQLKKLFSLKYLLLAGILFSFGKVKSQTISSLTIGSPISTATYGTVSSVDYLVTINRSGGTGSYTMSIALLPAGVTATFFPASPGAPAGSNGNSVTTTLTLTTNNIVNAINSPYPFTVTATGTNSMGIQGSLIIGKRNLAITGLLANSKVYDATIGATLNTSSASVTSGLVNGDVVNLNTSGATGMFSDKNVAVGKTVTASGFTTSGAQAGNYNLIQPTTTANITAAPVSPSFTASNKTYDGLTTASISGRSLTGVIGTDLVSLTGGSATFADKNVGTTKTVTATGLSLAGADAGNYSLTSTSATATADITAASLSITSNNQSKIYGTVFNFTGTEFTSSGLKNSETIGTVLLSSTGSPSGAAFGTHPITGSSATGGTFTASNYTITYNNGTMTVNKANLTITANNQTKTYGNLFSFAGTEFSSTGLQNGETIGSVTLTSTGSPVTAAVTSYPIVPSAATGGTFNAANYTIIYNNGTMTVNKANLTITADDRSKTFGATLTLGTTAFSSTGLQNLESIGGVTLASGGAINTANVGTYSITPSAATGGTFTTANYNITYTIGTLTVNAANLTITANLVNKTYGTAIIGGAGSTAFTFSATQNGNTLTSVTITYGTGAAATAPVGTYTNSVTASIPVGAGGFVASNYNITYVTNNIVVGAAVLTITATAQSKTYGTVFSFAGTEFTSSALPNGETVGSVTLTSAGTSAPAAVGSYPISISGATGGTFTASNYSITYNTGTLTVSKSNLSITANNQSKTFGATFTFAGTEFSATGLQNGETVGTVTLNSTGAAATAAVGSYSIIPTAATGGTFTAGNYNITYTNGTLTVNAANLTITANLVNKTYGTAITGGAGSTAFTSSGLISPNTLTTVTIAYGTGAAANAAVGTYAGSVTASAAVGANGFVASNYNISYVANDIIIATAPLTITPNAQSKVYGATFSFNGTEFTSVGLKNGETIVSVSLSSAGSIASAVVGTYPIVASSATGVTFNPSNYTITYASNVVMTVGKANTTTTVSTSATPVCFGTSITLTATISSTPSGVSGTVQFFDGATSLGTSAASGGVATLNVSSLLVGVHSTIKAIYSGDANYNTSTSGNITVDVTATSIGGTTSGAQTICQGSSPSSNLTLNGNTGSVVKWQKSTDAAFTTPVDIAITSTTLTSANIGVLNVTTYFRAVVQSGACPAVNSSTVIITVDPSTVGGTVSSSQTICFGDIPTDLVLTGSVGSIIKWEISTSNTFPNGSSTSNISVTSTTLAGTVVAPFITSAGTYYLRANVKSGLCVLQYSSIVSITVNALPNVYSISGTNTCQGISTGTINLSNSVTGVTYQLMLSDGTIVQSAQAGTGSVLSWATIPANTYKIQATNTNGCKSFTSNYFVASNPAPAAPLVTPNGAIICVGSGTPLTASGYYPNVLISEIFTNGTAPGWQQSNSSNNNGLQSINASQNAGGTVDWAILNSPTTYTIGGTNYTFQSPDNSKFIMTNHAVQSSSVPYTTTILYTPAFSTQGMASAAIKFSHTLKLNAIGSSLQPDEATIEASAGSITGPWAVIKTFSDAAGVQVGTTNGFVLDSVLLDGSYLNKNNVYFRFVYRAKSQGWWWAMDDVSISVAPQVNFTWSPTTELYTDAAFTIPYTGSPTPTVYAKPTVTRSYLVTTNITSANGCPANTTVTVTVNTPAAIITQPVSTIGCVGTSQTLTMAVSGSPVTYQWEVSTDGGNNWNSIPGETNRDLTIANPTPVFASYLYRNKVNSPSPCAANLISNEVSLKLKHVWVGNTDINWNTASNWADGVVPNNTCPNVYILIGRPWKPTLASGTGLVNNLFIETGAYLTVNGTGVMGVAGTITNAGTFDLLAGTLLLNGTTTQTIDGTVFKNKTINRLTLNNNVNVTGTDTLKISGALGFDAAASGKTFSAGTNNVSLLSSINYTANVNEIKNGNSISGTNFTVERYISTGSVHGQSWQLLSTAITGQSIVNSWQEGRVYKPGLGTRITSNAYTTLNGFDATSLSPSIKVFNPITDTYDGVTSTFNNLANPTGYYIFVRGDRSVLNGSTAPNPTVLRSTGTLNTGNTLPSVSVLASKFATVGNPYPSTIDLRKLYADYSGFLTFDIYVWDATLGGAYGVGGFRTLTIIGSDYNAVPAGGFYSTIANYMQSGQAFFVRSKGPAVAITFKESYKKDTSYLTSRNQLDSQIPIIQTTISGADAGAPKVMLDGALAIFGDEYRNDVNFEDAPKFINSGVNTGFIRDGKILAVERMKLPTATDTMHMNFSGAKQLSYTWSINLENMDGLGIEAWLWDKFLNTKSPLLINGNTDINFNVDNNAASTASDRFKIVFTKAVVPPVKLTSITATRNNDKTITVSWKVENENDVLSYTVERSTDGLSFNSLIVKAPLYNNGANADYTYPDAAALVTDNYYRIKVLSKDGQVQYSAVIKVDALTIPSSVSVNPNPVVNKEMNLVFVNKPSGTYDLTITNNLGQVVYRGQAVISTVIDNKKISLVDLKAAGVYQLTIRAQDGSTTIQHILVK